MSCWLSRFPGSRPDAPLLSRFVGFEPPIECVDINTLPSGFTQSVTGTNQAAPLRISLDPTLGVFARDIGVPVGDRRDGGASYVPAYAPTGAIGRLAIGRSPIGAFKQEHTRLAPVQVGSVVVFEEVNP